MAALSPEDLEFELDRLTTIIESQGVTIEALSQGPRGIMSPRSIDSEVQQYKLTIQQLQRERDELVRQVHDAVMAVEDGQPQAATEKKFFSSQLKRLQMKVDEQEKQIENEAYPMVESQRKVIEELNSKVELLTSLLNASEAKNKDLVATMKEFSEWKERYYKLHDYCESLQGQQSRLSSIAEKFGHEWEKEVNLRQAMSVQIAEFKKMEEKYNNELIEKQTTSIFYLFIFIISIVDTLVKEKTDMKFADKIIENSSSDSQVYQLMEKQTESINSLQQSVRSKDEQISILKSSLRAVLNENQDLNRSIMNDSKLSTPAVSFENTNSDLDFKFPTPTNYKFNKFIPFEQELPSVLQVMEHAESLSRQSNSIMKANPSSSSLNQYNSRLEANSNAANQPSRNTSYINLLNFPDEHRLSKNEEETKMQTSSKKSDPFKFDSKRSENIKTESKKSDLKHNSSDNGKLSLSQLQGTPHLKSVLDSMKPKPKVPKMQPAVSPPVSSVQSAKSSRRELPVPILPPPTEVPKPQAPVIAATVPLSHAASVPDIEIDRKVKLMKSNSYVSIETKRKQLQDAGTRVAFMHLKNGSNRESMDHAFVRAGSPEKSRMSIH